MKSVISNLKQRLLSGWTFIRIVRLALALLIIGEAWVSSQLLFAIVGGLLAVQALFNYGCCGTAGCDTDHAGTGQRSLAKAEEETTFEEVK